MPSASRGTLYVFRMSGSRSFLQNSPGTSGKSRALPDLSTSSTQLCALLPSALPTEISIFATLRLLPKSAVGGWCTVLPEDLCRPMVGAPFEMPVCMVDIRSRARYDDTVENPVSTCLTAGKWTDPGVSRGFTSLELRGWRPRSVEEESVAGDSRRL